MQAVRGCVRLHYSAPSATFALACLSADFTEAARFVYHVESCIIMPCVEVHNLLSKLCRTFGPSWFRHDVS